MKAFFVGFVKGFSLLFAIVLVLSIIITVNPALYDNDSFIYSVTFLFVFVEFLLIRRARLPQSYYLVAFLFNVIFFPFLFGIIDYMAHDNKKKQK